MKLAPIEFVEFQKRMTERVAEIPEVLGLMFAGSSADLSRADKYSDHDFYLIVQDEAAERFRQELFWLPEHEQILLRPRETEHGLKVFYRNGRMLEFAVFADSELDNQIAPTDSLVVFDRGGITERIANIKVKEAKPLDLGRELDLMLTLLHIGLGRYRRGEVLAANQHIKSYALNHLLGILREQLGKTESREDALNRYRRFELDYPDHSKRLAMAMNLPADAAAMVLIDVAAEVVPQELMANFESARALIEAL